MKKLALLSTAAALTLMFASDVSAQGTDPAAGNGAANPTPGAAVTDLTDTDRPRTDAYRVAPYGIGTRDADDPRPFGTGNIGDRNGGRAGAGTDNMNTYRARAAADNNDNVDWGWLGLIGLFGLVGLRGRNQQQSGGGTNR